MAIDREGDGPPLRRQERNEDQGERRVDLRATPFTDDVFNDEGYGRKRSGSERSYSLLVGIVLGIALVGGVGWYVFGRGNGPAFTPGEVQTVKADPTPYKIKPENPGGLQVDNQDKLVYDRVAKGAAPNRVENLLPPPEEPKAPPQKLKPAEQAAAPAKAEALPAAAPKGVAPADDQKALAAIVRSVTEPAKPDEAKAALKTEVAKVEPPKTDMKPDAAKAEAPKSAPAESNDAGKPADAPKTPAADPLVAAVAAATGKTPPPPAPADQPVQTAAVTPATTPSAATATPGAFQVQLASVPSQEAAEAEWKRVSGRHKDLFAGMSPAITQADLGDRGIYYRLRAGPLADKAAADALCSALSGEKIGCIVIKP